MMWSPTYRICSISVEGHRFCSMHVRNSFKRKKTRRSHYQKSSITMREDTAILLGLELRERQQRTQTDIRFGSFTAVCESEIVT